MRTGMIGHVRILAFALALMPPVMMAAPVDPATLPGIWKGSIGQQLVVACFNRSDNRTIGSYYYLRHLVPIEVGFDASNKVLEETDGIWDVELAAGSDTLTGSWKKKKDETLAAPITLTRAGAADPGACGSDAFVAPLEASSAPRVVSGPRADFDGHAYRTLSGLNQATIQILAPGSAANAINRDLRAFIDDSPAAVAEYNLRRRNDLASRGFVMDDENTVTPSYWSDRYLSINFYSWAAGMGKSGISSHVLTWDLVTGRRVDLWGWFGVAHDGSADDAAPLPKRLLAKFVKLADVPQGEDNCAANYAGGVPFRISLTATGMEFAQWPEGDGCDIGFAADFKSLLPYMTPSGRAAAMAIMVSAEKPAVRP